MKTRNLCMVLLAGLLAMPMGVSAKKGMGWLHLGEGNDSYYDETATTVPVKYEGKTYQAYPVIGEKGVYYVPNEKTFGTKNENLKILYLKDAELTKNIRCTKSTKQLAVVVSGKCSISYSKGSCIKLEKGDVYITGENGGETIMDFLNLQVGNKYHCIYAAKGDIGIYDLNLITDKSIRKNASISLDSRSGTLYIVNSYVYADTWFYINGQLVLKDVDVDTPNWWRRGYYILDQYGTKMERFRIMRKRGNSHNSGW